MFSKLGILILFLAISVSVKTERSLFDDIPFGGALVPSDVDYNALSSETVSAKVSIPQPTKPTSKPTVLKESSSTPSPSTSSLFDGLPNQGAFTMQHQHQEVINRPRIPRDSVDFDVTRIAPSGDFDMPYWDKRFLAPIVNSIASRDPTRPPSLFPILNTLRNVFPQKKHYGPPPRRDHHGWRPEPENSGKVSANSGGPTVIVYTHPKKEGADHQPQRMSSTEAPVKNEIHYHYHISEDNKPKPPPYGRHPPQRQPRPPPQSYGPPPPHPTKPGPYPPSVMAQDNTYRNTQGNVAQENFEDDFSRRTFISSNRPGSSYRPADTISFTKTPSTSYEVPPSFNAPKSTYAAPPSTKYGPPSHKEPDPTYGPPAPPPPPPQAEPVLGGDQYETTITLQTIPITRQVTELVQVPNVVHKVSSNRPHSASSINAEEFPETPSTSYGPPAPPPSKQKQTISSSSFPQSQTNNKLNLRENERPFETHLAQILGVAPAQTHNSKDTILQELLLNQARTPGFDLTVSELELLSLLQNSRNSANSGLFQTSSIKNNLFSGLLGGTRSGFLQPNQGWGSPSSIGGGGGGDGLSSLREAIREQRLQIALQDLRRQLREQNRDNMKERSSYRSLFTKGAMLLSALSIIPSMMSPMTAAMASQNAASTAAASFPNIMLPVTAAMGVGRRKKRFIDNPSNLEETTDAIVPPLRKGVTKYIRNHEWSTLRQCLQRDFCRNVVATGRISLLSAYSMLFENMEKNPWVQESLKAAEGNRCDTTFSCPKKNGQKNK